MKILPYSTKARECAAAVKRLLCLCVLFLLPCGVRAEGAGGGILGGGLFGEYFPNETLSGTPAFSRRDVRVDFDWGPQRAPGGSVAPGFAAVGADHFSVRWTGQVMARFSESYSFFTEVGGDETAVFQIRPEGAGSFTTVASGGSFALTAGTRYDVRLEYREGPGDARCVLRWSSPSTPLETLDCATLASTNVDVYASQLWANAMDGGRDEWGAPFYGAGAAPARDANGWPTGDGTNIVWEGEDVADRRGVYTLTFTGRAEVSGSFFNIQFSTGATNHGQSLPFGAGWDSGTNTTTATVNIVDGASILYLNFTGTRRSPGDTTATGVANVRLMRPPVPGGAGPQPVGSVGHAAFREAVQRFSALRWILNFDTEQTWASRRLPNYSTRVEIGRLRNWEHMVMMSNETGKDLYLCLPVRATDDYITKVAQLLRYGSDGVNPYTSPQENPVYPPLNPNLRMIVERENEIWNFSFTNFNNNLADLQSAVAANSKDWQAVNFDGAYTGNPNDAWRRWHALRTVRTSQIFRSVFGDAAMGPRVRVLYEYQYDNGNNTAIEGLTFIDRFFNNSDGVAHVPDPHPVSYHLWGGGGAVYYGSGNAQGTQSAFGFAEPGFESGGSAWTFSGTAGLYSAAPKAEVWSAGVLGGSGNGLAQNEVRGCRFTVGAQPVAVYELGRYKLAGNGGTHAVTLIREGDRAEMGTADVSLASASAGQFIYAPLQVPVILAANTSYYLVSAETAGGDSFHTSVPVTALAGLAVNARTSGVYGNPSYDTTTWTFTDSAGTATFGPVNMRYATAEVGTLGFPPDPPEGTHAAYVQGLGQMQQSLFFPAAGTYALRMQAAARAGLENGVRVYFDNSFITPDGSNHAAARTTQWIPGEGFNRSSLRYENNTTFVFTVAAPGTHTIRIEGLGIDRYAPLNTPPDLQRATWFDQMEIVSADALFAGGIPGAGEANGQIAAFGYQQQLFTQQRYAQAFGLQPVAYEGGWSVGGDFASTAFQNWCKFHDPRARQAQTDSINIFARSGSRMYVFGTYTTWPVEGTSTSGTWPLAQAIDDHNAALPQEPTNGIPLPNVLRPTNNKWFLNANANTGSITATGGFFYWNVIAPATASYVFGSAPAGSQIAVDGVDTSGTVALTAGLHTVRIRSTQSGVTFSQMSITQAGTLAAPVLNSAVEGAGQVTLNWSAVSGATGYVVRYGTTAGQPDQSLELGTTTSRIVTGLTNGTTYFFSIAARNANGLSLPSGELGATPIAPGQQTSLASWEFTGLGGLEGVDVSDPPDSASGNATVSSVTRGPGLSVGYNQFAANTFASGAAQSQGQNYGTDLATAKTRQQFYQITLAPAALRTLSFSRVDFRPSFQNQASGATIGAALTYSTDGVNFIDAPAATGTPAIGINGGALLSVNLAGITALQTTTSSVTLRIYTWGAGRFECTGLGGPGTDLVVVGSYGFAPTQLDAWRALHGLPGDGSQDLANPAGDGIANLLKYAFNLAPSAGQLSQPALPLTLPVGGTAGLPRVSGTVGARQFEFIRRKASANPGITYTAESSATLLTWAPLSIIPSIASIDATWERVTFAIPEPTAPLFLRVKVE